MKCCNCEQESGYSFLCENCMKFGSEGVKKKAHELWRAYILQGEPVCIHCEKWFAWDCLCGDHFPYTKGSHPEVRYDIRNGRKSCKPCNTSGNPNRKQPQPEELFLNYLP